VLGSDDIREYNPTTAAKAHPPRDILPLLPPGRPVLLAVPPMRVCHLPGLYGRECLGAFLQRDNLGLPGLRGPERFRQSVMTVS
jgi:hypothetical protein